MGTSGSYGGSGGRDWRELQQELDHWLDHLPGVGDDPSPGDESDGLRGAEDEPAAENGPDPDSSPDERPKDLERLDPAVLRVLRPLRRGILAGGSGSGDVPSGRESGGGGRSPSGSGRARSRVGRVGGRLAAGISGIRAGNAAALLALGLNLTELQTLDPYRQAQRLLKAATEEGVATTLEEDELQVAASRTAIWGITSAEAPNVDEVIRRFIVEYVYEVFLTEGGAILRGGQRDGVAANGAEGRVRDTIVALVRAIPIELASLDATDLAGATERVLTHAMQIHAG